VSGDDKKAKPALIAALAIASFGTMVLLPRAQAQLAPPPQCTPEEKKDLENYARTIRKFKQVGADQMKLVCEALEAGEAAAATALKERLEKLNEFVKDVNPVLKKWFGTGLPEELGSKIDIDAASRYCRAQKGQAESFLEDEAKRVDAELDRCGMRI
jgi:hypothetical protein